MGTQDIAGGCRSLQLQKPAVVWTLLACAKTDLHSVRDPCDATLCPFAQGAVRMMITAIMTMMTAKYTMTTKDYIIL